MLQTYPNTFKVFDKYLIDVYKLNTKEYYKTVPNGMLLLQTIRFLEVVYDIIIIDAVAYMSLYSNNKNHYNELLKDTVNHCFWRIENNKELNFLPF